MERVLTPDILFNVLEQTTTEGIFIHDGKEIIEANERFLVITGYEKKDFLHKDPLIIIHPEYRSIAREHILAQDETPYQAVLTGKNGIPIHVEMQGKQVQSKSTSLRVVLVRNISQMKSIEEDLQLTKTKLSLKFRETKNILRSTVDALASTIKFSDPYTWKHQLRVSELCKEIGRLLIDDGNIIDALVTAAKLHDIGKLSIPKEILIKPSRPTQFEYGMIREHPSTGFNIIKNIPFCKPVSLYIVQHHETLDGLGYPFGLFDEDIEFPAKILSVVDIFEAISSHRPYRPALGVDYAIGYLEKYSNTKYDKNIVDCCKELSKTFTFLNQYEENYSR